MHYIVNVSGGLTSFEALRRTIERHGKAAVTAVFANTRMEDRDLYRFLADQQRYFGIEIITLADGRNVFDVWRDERMITIGAAAPCSKLLKREVIDRWIAERFGASVTTRVFGYSWDEVDRMVRLEASLHPIPVWFPLAEPPYLDKCNIAADLERIGIKPPRLYDLGFEHNNCGGACVKAGQAHWAKLWRTLPDVYSRWERGEETFRAYVGKDVSILKDRRGGTTKPMTLAEFRGRIERGEAYDQEEWGGCGCFAPVQQGRMDDLLLQAGIRTKAA
jgi:hypothetical protein